jgi:hypothetical protein
MGYITFVDCSHLSCNASSPEELDINYTASFVGILPDFHNCYNLSSADQSCYKSTIVEVASRPGFAEPYNLVHYKKVKEYIGCLRYSLSTSVLSLRMGKMKRPQLRSFGNSKQELKV